MKNLAGHDVSIFLFQFVVQNRGISFILNESIAQDMYPDIEMKMKPLVQACCETLMRYKHFCTGTIIMDGNILCDDCFEVMLETGVGQYFDVTEKNNLFRDSNDIATLLCQVMDDRTKEIKAGIYHQKQDIIPEIARTESTNAGLAALGKARHGLNDVDHVLDIDRIKTDRFPQGVSVKVGYDHRGQCFAFEHATLGDIGKVVLAYRSEHIQVLADLNKCNSAFLAEKKKIFKEIIVVLESGFKHAAAVNKKIGQVEV